MSPRAAAPKASPLVTPAWLAENLGRRDVRVVDGSWHMPQLKRDARAEFAQAHVPGAVFFDIDAIADPRTSLPHMLPRASEFARKVGQLGIGDRDRVIVYDSRGVASAARVWWTFRAFGHDKVAVLDGGLPRWRAEATRSNRERRCSSRARSPRGCAGASSATWPGCARTSQLAGRRCSTRALAAASPAPSPSHARGFAPATFRGA